MARLSTILIVSLLVAGCATETSPAPSITSTPSASPLIGPSAGAPSPSPSVAPSSVTPMPATPEPPAAVWPVHVGDDDLAFGPDGTIYARVRIGDSDRSELVALDAGGRVKAGWPIEEPPGVAYGLPEVGPDGSIYVSECSRTQVGCALRRFDPAGTERPGWPFIVPDAFACPDAGSCLDQPRFGPDGTVYLPAWRSTRGQQVIAIDDAGRVMPGWPVAPGARGLWSNDVQIGHDGTLFVINKPDGTNVAPTLAAYGPNGRLRAGWPVTLPEASDYRLGPSGTAIVWSLIDDVGELCPSPRRTLYTVLGPDGQVLPGWPRGSTGHASPPVVSGDGTLHYVSAKGNVYAHDRAGAVKAGWPVAVLGAAAGCGPASPYLAPDGTVYVTAHDSPTGSQVVARSPDGRSRPGWPYIPAGSLVGPCLDSECFGGVGGVTFGADGTVYLLVYAADGATVRADVVALDDGGRGLAGWPVRLPFDPTTVYIGRTVMPDGRLVVRGGDQVLSLDPDGRISD
jgi:hypothetical protein